MPDQPAEEVLAYLEDGEVLLVWPYCPEDKHGLSLLCWAYRGQHASATTGYLAGLRRAPEAAALSAIRQWRSEGPDRQMPIRLLKRMPSRSARLKRMEKEGS